MTADDFHLNKHLHSRFAIVLFNTEMIVAGLFIVSVCLGISQPLPAADYEQALTAYRTGDYQTAEEITQAEVTRGVWSERWPCLLLRTQLTTGKIEAAVQTHQEAISRYRNSLVLRRLGLSALRQAGMLQEAHEAEAELVAVLERSLRGYITRDNLIAAGRYLTDQGEDARKVLELFYDRVMDRDPDFLETYIATAELAITKGDFQVAAETIQSAERLGMQDPQLLFLKAQALQHTDPQAANESLRQALQLNPKHLASLRFAAQNAIDQERYDVAQDLINEALVVNMHDQLSWALMAVLAHLRGDYEIEKLYRAAALSTWSENPDVDHLIGKKLSDKYRFAEGAAYQNRALDMNTRHTAAQFQLAQDQLRLGDEAAGWSLAEAVSDKDPYNVVAYNLLTLKEKLDTFVILKRDNIHVRMERSESEIYGESVLDLLAEAKSTLCDKYRLQCDEPVWVEIFPEQSDFAIRTFGLPGGDGFLGVCFGKVITANSPASQGVQPANWQSVLWHEFAHVVTLEKTRNRMPRWLSEGISVYEERQKDPAWGEAMTPRYHEMLLSPELTPVSDLSSAFLSPPSPLHLQFAYFQSSLVVEFLIQQHGFDALIAILDDLAAGLPINDALARNVGSLAKLDVQFSEHAHKVANSLGPLADWSREDLPDARSTDLEGWAGWLRFHPTNVWALRQHAQAAMNAQQWQAAESSLARLEQLGAMTGERNGPLRWRVQVAKGLKNQDAIQKAIVTLTDQASDALPELLLQMKLARESEDWETLVATGQQAVAINPLRSDIHELIARAAQQTGQAGVAIDSLLALLALEPIDPVAIRFQLATAYEADGQLAKAKRAVLESLESAPRYRDALRLLLKLSQPTETSSAKPDDLEATNSP